MDSKGQAGIAVVLLIILIVVIVAIVSVFVLMSGPADSGYYGYDNYFELDSGNDWAGDSPASVWGLDTSNSGSNSGVGSANSWCVPGQTIPYQGASVVITGMETYNGKSFCAGSISQGGEQLKFYSDENGEEWYIVDLYGTVLVSSSNPYDVPSQPSVTPTVNSYCDSSFEAPFTDSKGGTGTIEVEGMQPYKGTSMCQAVIRESDGTTKILYFNEETAYLVSNGVEIASGMDALSQMSEMSAIGIY